MEKVYKITTKKQMQKLMELMNEHPDIRSGTLKFDKLRTKEKWEHFTICLNALGPPTRTSKEWQRVWIHYKANLKRRLGSNRKNFIATAGHPSNEQSQDSLDHFKSRKTKEFSSGKTFSGTTEKGYEEVDEAYLLSDYSIEFLSRSPTPTRNSENSSIEHTINERLEILKGQVETQKKILQVQEKMEETAHKQYHLKKILHDKEMELKEVELTIAKKKLELLNTLF